MSTQPAPRAFTVDEFYRMAESGIFTEDDRVELLDGAIVQMSPIGSRHAATVDRLTRLLIGAVGERAVVRVQNPVRLDIRSEPQPDVTLLRPRADFYATAHPGPGDVLLVIEVADTSARFDRTVKMPLYARAGIPEVWLVDLESGRIEIYSEPSAAAYRQTTQVARGERLAPRSMPDVSLLVDEILG